MQQKTLREFCRVFYFAKMHKKAAHFFKKPLLNNKKICGTMYVYNYFQIKNEPTMLFKEA
jgi:hypothetical protein